MPAAPDRRWTAREERDLTWLWGDGEPEWLAQQLADRGYPRRTATAILLRAERLRLGSPGKGRMTQQEVCRYLGVHPDLLHRLVRAVGLRVVRRPHSKHGRPGVRRGCKRPFAFSWEQVQRVEEELVREMAA